MAAGGNTIEEQEQEVTSLALITADNHIRNKKAVRCARAALKQAKRGQVSWSPVCLPPRDDDAIEGQHVRSGRRAGLLHRPPRLLDCRSPKRGVGP